jgi:hypothetical protein
MKSALMIVIVLVTVSGFVVGQPKESAPGGADTRKEIVAKLGEIVKWRERLVENYGRMLKAGRAEVDSSPEIELAEARLALANEEGNRSEGLKQLKAIVAANEAKVARMKGVARDRVGANEMERAEVALLEAQVRLLRAGK